MAFVIAGLVVDHEVPHFLMGYAAFISRRKGCVLLESVCLL